MVENIIEFCTWRNNSVEKEEKKKHRSRFVIFFFGQIFSSAIFHCSIGFIIVIINDSEAEQN